MKKIGLSPHLYCEPLKGVPDAETPFTWVVDAATRNAIALREQRLDAAFLTPIDYARESSLYYIVPRIAVSSASADGTVTLHFREGLRAIRSLAVDPSSVSEIILARLVLAEEFDIEPKILPWRGGLEEALQKADATLLVGDASLGALRRDRHVLDLVEAWTEMTDLPYVHGFWCGRENGLSLREIDSLRQACMDGLGILDGIASRAVHGDALSGQTPEQLRAYLDGLSYEFRDEVEESIAEFLRYAYYHGVLPDVAELQFYPPSDSPEGQRPSRN